MGNDDDSDALDSYNNLKRKREDDDNFAGESESQLWPADSLLDTDDGEGGLPDWTLKTLVNECANDSRFNRVAASPSAEAKPTHTQLRSPHFSKLLALDCEMVEVDHERSAVGRISLIERIQAGPNSGNTFVRLDEYVMPDGRVTDYREAVSGLDAGKLASARLSEHSAHAQLLNLVAANDVLVGHTLASDLFTLNIAHENVLDTALLFAVDDVASFTLSLKDAVLHVMPEHPGAYTFQLHNAAHDSVIDAMWALRLAVLEARKVEHGSVRTPALVSVPERFMAQLHVKCLPQNADEATIRQIFAHSGVNLPESASIRAIKEGKEKPSTVVDFASCEDADATFKAVRAQSWPEEEGFLCKRLLLPQAPAQVAGIECFVKSNRRISRTVKLAGTISRSIIGRVIGKNGSKLREIRRRSGALVRINPPQDPERDAEQSVDIMAGERTTVDSAFVMLRNAARGERLPASQRLQDE